MSIKQSISTFKNNYVIRQVAKTKLPEFTKSQKVRYQLLFSGRVQKVGFRLEVCEMAKRLGLTGYCMNLENGDVEAELQGEKEKIMYLITFMHSLKRIKIEHYTLSEISLQDGETTVIKK